MYETSREAVRRYVAKHKKKVIERLGAGVDGLVYATNEGTAIKGYRFSELYRRERDAYVRLHQRKCFEAPPFKIPKLVFHDDELEVLEITVVSPPFLLDFTSAYIDRKSPFSSEQLEKWYEDKENQFGKDRWQVVDLALSTLKRHGIWLSDVHPGNARFENDPE